jgi:hypothetical protein
MFNPILNLECIFGLCPELMGLGVPGATNRLEYQTMERPT